MQERPAHTAAPAQHPFPEALWAVVATVTSTADAPEAGVNPLSVQAAMGIGAAAPCPRVL